MENKKSVMGESSPAIAKYNVNRPKSLSELIEQAAGYRMMAEKNMNKSKKIYQEIDAYSKFNMDDITSVIAGLVSTYEKGNYVVQKTTYTSTVLNYNKPIPCFSTDILLIVNNKESLLYYYDYDIEAMENDRNVLVIDKVIPAKVESIYNDKNKSLQFIDSDSLKNVNPNRDNNISVDNVAFENFEYVKEFIEYLISYKIANGLRTLSLKIMYELLKCFIDSKEVIFETKDSVKKIG